MGIYDRDYARDEDSSGGGMFSEPGSATRWLLGITVGIFFLQLLTMPGRHSASTQPGLTEFLELNTTLFWQGQVWRILTYGFAHDQDIFHILFNMLGLFFFGRAIEDRYGSREFVVFYLSAIVLGGLAFLATHWVYPGRVVGASAAIVGILVLFACNWPNQRVLLFFIFPVPVWLLAVLFVALDALVFVGGERGRTAVEAHLAGAAFAFLYHRNNWHLSGWYRNFQEWRRRRSRPQLRVYHEEDEPIVKLGASLSEEDQLEAKVDAVLEKLSRVGQENLTPHEKEILQKASEVFRKRRG